MTICVVKNFLKKEDFTHLENVMHGEFFPWYLNSVARPKDGFHQLVHIFYNDTVNSPFFTELKPILDILKPHKLIRIKANILFQTPTLVEHGYHVDMDEQHHTAILYLNSNNGYTQFREGKKITSEKNKLIKFNGSLWHTGSSCTDQHHRTVINFNYIPKKGTVL
jgi:hypothetical protein|tara:strand:+ start:64 stop:558 length:495 start_codon:yes stop_codon:yes gene_type:complete